MLVFNVTFKKRLFLRWVSHKEIMKPTWTAAACSPTILIRIWLPKSPNIKYLFWPSDLWPKSNESMNISYLNKVLLVKQKATSFVIFYSSQTSKRIYKIFKTDFGWAKKTQTRTKTTEIIKRPKGQRLSQWNQYLPR